MSHFTVLVVGNNPEAQLAPYHEFECTGRDDQYVLEFDITDESRQEYEQATERCLKDPNGMLHSIYDEQGNYKEEFLQVEGEEPFQRRGLKVPEGWEETTRPAKDERGFAQWAYFWHGLHIKHPNSIVDPEAENPFKYGFIEVDEHGEVIRIVRRTNPNAKWDWYSLGGRWTGFFKLKPGHEGTAGEPSWMNNEAKAGYADQCTKGAIDFAGMEAEARAEAEAFTAQIRAAVGTLVPPKPFAEFRKDYEDRDTAASAYFAHPWIAALREARLDPVFQDPAVLYADLDKFIEDSVAHKFATYAVIKDGQWYQKGQMGWWGVSTDEKTDSEWVAEVRKLLNDVSDDTLLSVYDCHI